MAAIMYESYYGVLPLSDSVIEHHGIKGQKWYKRRWQNLNGSLTPAGRVHYGVGSPRKARTDHREALRQYKKGLDDEEYSKLKRSEQKANANTIAQKAEEVSNRKGDIKEKHAARLENEAKRAGYESLDAAIRDAAKNQSDAKKAERQKVLDSGNVSKIKMLKDVSTDELRRALKTAKTKTEKEELYNALRKEKVAEKEAEHRSDIDLKKQAAIESGDPRKIKKYLKEMSTDELQEAINRTEKMNKIADQAADRAEKERILRKARKSAVYSAINSVWNGTQELIYDIKLIRWENGGKQGPKPTPPKKLPFIGTDDATKELRGKAKEIYEKGLGEFATQEANKKREQLKKLGVNEVTREKEVAKTLLSSLPKSFFDDKSMDKKAEKAYEDSRSEAAKKAANAARDNARKEGKSDADAEEAAKQAASDFFNPSKKTSREKTLDKLRDSLYAKTSKDTDSSDVKAKPLSEIMSKASDFTESIINPRKSSVDTSDKSNQLDTNTDLKSIQAKWRGVQPEGAKESRAKALRAAGKTISEIAKALGISTSTASDYVNDKKKKK